jgi:hypothetical protein
MKPEEYKKSQQYTKAKTKLEVFTKLQSTIVFLWLWLGKGYNSLDLFLRSFDFHPIATGVLYLVTLTLGASLINIPLSLYSDFVLEAHYGFNKKTLYIFFKDWFLYAGLSIVLGVPLFAGILSFLQYAGSNAWLFCWVLVSVFSLFMVFITPTFILPLFNKLEPLSDGELKSAIEELAAKLRFPNAGVFVMDGSKRSSHSNAFFAGFGSSKRIVLFDTLVEKQTSTSLIITWLILSSERNRCRFGTRDWTLQETSYSSRISDQHNLFRSRALYLAEIYLLRSNSLSQLKDSLFVGDFTCFLHGQCLNLCRINLCFSTRKIDFKTIS